MSLFRSFIHDYLLFHDDDEIKFQIMSAENDIIMIETNEKCE